jgi:hypothetical protein
MLPLQVEAEILSRGRGNKSGKCMKKKKRRYKGEENPPNVCVNRIQRKEMVRWEINLAHHLHVWFDMNMILL